MLKKLYLTACLLILQSSYLKSQNYYPYPKDSVFFELNTGGDDLMTLVKSEDTNNIFQPVNNLNRLLELPIFNGLNYGGTYPLMSWIGKTSFDNNKISFVTTFEDTLVIDLNKNLNETDTFPLSIYSKNQELPYNELLFEGKIVICYDAKVYENGDSIKEYRFAYLNTNNEPYYNLSQAYGITDPNSNIPEYVLRVSKNNGIIETPDFNYFPYCKQYKYKGKITDYLNLTTSHAEKVFLNNPGDEIHARNYFQSLATKTTSTIKVVIDQVYDDIEKTITTNYDLWTHIEDNGPSGNFVETNFDQITETIALNNYPFLQRVIPDGLGCFYRTEKNTFVKHHNYGSNVSDSIYIFKSDDLSNAGQGYNFFREGLGGTYFYSNYGGTFHYYFPTYNNIEDLEYGTPFSESFILNLKENPKEDIKIIYNSESISIENTDIIDNARIYSLDGKFIRQIKKSELNHPIDHSTLSKGTYFLICWDGKKAHSLKFIK